MTEETQEQETVQEEVQATAEQTQEQDVPTATEFDDDGTIKINLDAVQ